MTRFGVVLDACVLVPVIQADTLLRLAEAELYRPLWNSQILLETTRALEKIHPHLQTNGGAKRRISQMNLAFSEACVEDWERLVPTIELPDPNDRHVVATALIGQADLIVTHNTKDFPAAQLRELNIEVQSPDDFLLNQLDLSSELVMATLHRQASATRNPQLREADILDRLEHCGAKRFSAAARQQLWRI